VNLDLQRKCLNEKKDCSGVLNVPISPRLIDRVDCYYRLGSIHWIDDIIMLKNLEDPIVKYWEETYKNKKGSGEVVKAYLRLEEGSVDYLLAFEITVKGYLLKSAYPHTHNGSKHETNKKYENYSKSIKKGRA
jgi:hypothetical protein